MLWKCLLDNTEYSSATGFSNHLRKLNISSKEYYDKFLKKSNENLCVVCNSETAFENITKGYKKHCSVLCAMRSEDHRKSVSNRFKSCPEKLNSYREKIKKYHDSIPEDVKTQISDKRIKTVIDKYGKDYLSNRTKKQWEKYSQEEKENISKKIMESRSKSFKYKKFLLNGKEYCIQGYEPSTIKLILENFPISESDITIGASQIPMINCVNRRHYPDIYIKKYNLLIDVKSKYTFLKNIDKCLENEKYSKLQGYNYMFAIFSRDPKKIFGESTKAHMVQKYELDEFKNKLNWAISSQASKLDEGSTTIRKE